MSKSITELRPDYTQAMDLRGEPSHVCACGSYIWNVKCSFENYEIVTYFRDMECALCGSMATAPIPDDMPEWYVPTSHFEEEEDNE